ncbi:MAG: glycosyltransferase [Hyphomicrobiaceae bacterium]|nr:glycosyltransferase [Hyphomicrobiaceae bacterium]
MSIRRPKPARLSRPVGVEAGVDGKSRGTADPRMTEAIRGLWQRWPELSARGPAPGWLLPGVALLAFAVAFGLVVEWRTTVGLTGALLLVPFAAGTGLRLYAALEILRRPPTGPRHRRLPSPRMPGPLPSYAVLVALYDEAEVLPTLLSHLLAFDYPPDRLEIVLVLEARDTATRAAATRLQLPRHVRIVVVPNGGPRTKPKALNYALTTVTSDLVVVYDAEDRPEPDQLRMAAAAFARGSPRLACLQARLNIYNPDAGFFARQFTLEYSALFDGLLPALERLRCPIPLGGTSNHFRTTMLRAAGAWDPYNVTEDADLGIRLARMGLTTGTLASTTWEEAPTHRRVWLGQRRRWLKGWMQTWLVHMRRPGRLAAELGLLQLVAVQAVMTGVLVSALAYPIFLALLAAMVVSGELGPARLVGTGAWLWWAALANLTLGLWAPMLAASLAVVRRGRAWLVWHVPLMVIYWLFVSWAGYRALIELGYKPFHWEKTRHGAPHGARRGYRRRRARTAAAKVPSSR